VVATLDAGGEQHLNKWLAFGRRLSSISCVERARGIEFSPELRRK